MYSILLLLLPLLLSLKFLAYNHVLIVSVLALLSNCTSQTPHKNSTKSSNKKTIILTAHIMHTCGLYTVVNMHKNKIKNLTSIKPPHGLFLVKLLKYLLESFIQ